MVEIENFKQPNTDIEFTNVLYLPSIGNKIIISATFLTNKGFSLFLHKTGGWMKFRNKIIAYLFVSQGHYWFHTCRKKFSWQRKVNTVSAKLIHARFGHTPLNVLDKMQRNKCVTDLKVPSDWREHVKKPCGACLKGKMQRKQFTVDVDSHFNRV